MSWATAVLDLLLPPACACCDAPVDVQGHLCAACFTGLAFIAAPSCRRCGLPFASAARAGPASICVTCAEHPPSWTFARAAFLYDDRSRRLILPLKHADRQENAAVLGLHMARAGRDLLARADLLVPVPLHRWRLFRRGFNQAALLARAVGRHAHRPVLVDGLRRIAGTRKLGSLSAAERQAEVGRVFAARPGALSCLAERRIILIDDVLTTGATANACARALLDAGASNVDVLVATRVPDPRTL